MDRREAISKLVALTAAVAIPIETLEAMLPIQKSYTTIDIECVGWEITSRAPGVVTGKMTFRVDGKLGEHFVDLSDVVQMEHPDGGKLSIKDCGEETEKEAK